MKWQVEGLDVGNRGTTLVVIRMLEMRKIYEKTKLIEKRHGSYY